MAQIDDLTQQLNTLTARFNQLLDATKSITNFDLKASIDGTEEIPIAGGKKINTQQIIDISTALNDAYTYKDVAYTITENDKTINCDGTFTITLPAAASVLYKIYVIKNSGLGTITVDANSSETIDDALTIDLMSKESLIIQSIGGSWIII